MTDALSTQIENGVLHLQLNRPDKKNALSQAMYMGLAEALEKAQSDTVVRAIVITGSDDCFTSGNDLMDFLENPPSGEEEPVMRFLTVLVTNKKPLVAGVAGHAVGIGTTLLLHCDLVYAADSARFQLPFVSLGLCPEAASSYLLPKVIGDKRAAEMLLLAEPMAADEAVHCGLVNGLVEGSVVDYAREIAERLAKLPAASLRLTKQFIRQYDRDTVVSIMREEAVAFLQQLHSEEAKEAMTAFLEKRKPDFSQFD